MSCRQIFLAVLIHLLSVVSAVGQCEPKINELINHANTHIWLGRSWSNALPEFQKAASYIDSAWVEIENCRIDSITKQAITRRLKAFDLEIAEMQSICIDNMNGRYPLYMSLMGNISNYERIDEPVEIACENALDMLLNTNTFRPSKPLKDLMCFAVIEVEPYDPTLEEVCHQFIANNSNAYAINRHELTALFGEIPNNFGQKELMAIQSAFATQNVGKFKISIHDQVDGVHYAGADFELIDPRKMTVHSHSYADGFIVDKRGVTGNAVISSIVYLMIYANCFGMLILACLMIIFREQKRSVREVLTAFGGLNLGLAVSAGISFGLLMLCRSYAPDPGDFFLSVMGKLWRITLPLLFGIAVPVATVLMTTLLTKKMFIRTERSSAMLWAGSAVGGLVPIGFFFYEFYESRMLDLILGWSALILLLAGTTAGWQYFLWNQQNRSIRRLISCALSLLSAVGIFLFLIEDHNSLSMWFYLLPAGLFVPFVLSLFKAKVFAKLWSRFITRGKDGTISLNPGRISSLNRAVNDTIAVNSGQINVPFREDIENELADALTTVQTEKKIGLVSIKGNRGIGKTTIIKKVTGDLVNLKQIDRCFYSDCDEFQDGNTVPYEPFVEAFGDAMGEGAFLRADRQAQELLSKLKPGLQETPIGNMALSFVSDQSFAGASLQEVSKVFEVYFTKWVEEAKREEKSVPSFLFIVEDIQWIDKDSLQLFKRFIEMIVKLKKRMSFRFTILLSQRASTVPGEEINMNFEELTNYLNESLFHTTEIVYPDDAEEAALVDRDFFDAFINEAEIALNYSSRKTIANHFENQNYYNPAQILESLNYIIMHHWLEERKGEIVLKKEVSLKNLPLPRQLRELYAEKFELLDKDLRRVMETAAYIGSSFEANTLARIWKMDRLELLHMLRFAEDLGLVEDVSEKDDVYQFTSKNLVSELKKYAAKHESGDNQPQIVKEYHKQIVEIMLKEKNIDPNTYDLSIVCQLADRTFKLKEYMFEKAIELNLAAVTRNLSSGSMELAKKYLDNLIALSTIGGEVNTLTRLKIKLLKLKILPENSMELAEELNREFTELQGLKDSSALQQLYQEFYLRYLKLSYDQFKDGHTGKGLLEEILDTKNILFKSRYLEVATDFYRILISYPAREDFEKKFEAFKNLEQQIIDNKEQGLSIYGRVLNELGINCPDQSKKTKYYRQRVYFILKKIGCLVEEEKSISDLLGIIRSRYTDLTIEDKEDINFSMGAWARHEYAANKNYEISLEMSNSLKEWNLLLVDYRGYSTASLYVGLCYADLYEHSADDTLIPDWFDNYEECYYELGEQGMEGEKTMSSTPQSQYLHLCYWLQSMAAIGKPSRLLKGKLAHALDDFMEIYCKKGSVKLKSPFDAVYEVEKMFSKNVELLESITNLKEFSGKVAWEEKKKN